MTVTYLQYLIGKSVEASLVNKITRESDAIAEGIIKEILKDPATRAEFTELVKAAFKKSWEDLGKEIPNATQ